MKYILLRKRNQLYYNTWEKEKNYLTMEDCADMFNCPIGTFYRIVQKESKRSQEVGTDNIKEL